MSQPIHPEEVHYVTRFTLDKLPEDERPYWARREIFVCAFAAARGIKRIEDVRRKKREWALALELNPSGNHRNRVHWDASLNDESYRLLPGENHGEDFEDYDPTVPA